MGLIKKNKIVTSSTSNFVGNLLGFLVTYSISFFLSPYIVGMLGESAYGFVSLATSFTNYITLATVALNSLASRFISIAIFNNENDKAQKYYSSVMIANIILSLIFVIPCTIFITKLENFIEIPIGLIIDVKILFAVIFLGFFISLISSLFSVAVFVENKLYLTAIHNTEAAVLRLILTVAMFIFLPIHVFYIGIITLITNLYIIFWQYYYKRKYIPQLKVRIKKFEFNKIIELIKAGIWNLISQLSGLLNTGLDLLLANKFISPSSMGVLSIASTLPSMIQAVLGSVSSAFTPNLTKYYAHEKYDEMVSELEKSIRMMNLVLIVPMAGITVFGGSFYALWQPTQNPQVLQTLSVLKILCLTFTGGMAAVHEIFVITNKLKPQAIATLVSGILNVIIVYFFLSKTNTGIYAIAGISSVIAILRNIIFTFPYAAKCIKQKWYVFYKMSFVSFGTFILLCAVYYIIEKIIILDSWIKFIFVCIPSGLLGLAIVFFIMLKKSERKIMITKVINKFSGKFIKTRDRK